MRMRLEVWFAKALFRDESFNELETGNYERSTLITVPHTVLPYDLLGSTSIFKL